MQFIDRSFSYINIVVFSFRKCLSIKSEFSEIVEEVRIDATDEDFSEMLALLVQDLEGMKVAQALNFECAPCDARQCDKVESSALGELTR